MDIAVTTVKVRELTPGDIFIIIPEGMPVEVFEERAQASFDNFPYIQLFLRTNAEHDEDYGELESLLETEVLKVTTS